MWLTNTAGKPDAALTFATIAFAVVSLSLILGSLGEVNLGTWAMHFQPMDSGTMGVYLSATFTAYVARRWTTAHYEGEQGKEE